MRDDVQTAGIRAGDDGILARVVPTTWTINGNVDGVRYPLRIDVRYEPFGATDSFYRVKEDGPKTHRNEPTKVWVWRKWSMADKPTVYVSAEAEAALNRLLFAHPVLSRILDQFGYSTDDTAAQSDSKEPT